MKTSLTVKFAAALVGVAAVNHAMASHDRDSVVTAVFSRSFNGYERPVRTDGSPAIQTYLVAKGGYAPGLGKDPSIDDVKFAGIVRVLGKYLAKQGYYPAKDAKKADLMLVIHWGKTVPFNSGVHDNIMDEGLRGFTTLQQLGKGIGGTPGAVDATDGVPASAATFGSKQDAAQAAAAVNEAAEEEMVQGMYEIRFAEDMRVSADTYNANLLGYTSDLRHYSGSPSLYAGAGSAYYDMLSDIESERYYIAITAYDFQDMLRHKRKKGLWRTVASIGAEGNRFDEKLMAMVDKASRYFGRDSDGHLIRQFEYTPHVNFGDLKVLGVVDERPAPKN